MGISQPENYRAALYIRLSKEDDGEGPSESVTNQRSLLEGFAQCQDLTVFDTYIDDGWSGTGFDRPAFRRMIGDIESGRVNMVITKDLSRLGRDYILTGHYMERYFPERGVRYISLLDGIDTGVESSANDITPFRAIMNDMYAKDISKKIRSVKRDKQRKGLFIGGKPVYGYRMHPTEKNRIVIDEGAAPVVRRIFTLALEGISCRKIAERLNGEGIPTPAAYCGREPRGGRWTGEGISQMLRNETYLGHMVQGRSVKVSYKSPKCRRQRPEDWVVVKNTHEPLVAEAAFRKVGQLLDSRRHTRSRSYDFLLKGLIFCHECGHPLGVLNRPTAAGEDRLFFVCRTYQRCTGAGLCTCHSIGEQRVTEAVLGEVKRLCGPYLTMERLLPIAIAALNTAGQGDNRIRQLRSRVAGLNANLDRAYLDRLEGLLEESDFLRIRKRISGERSALEEELRLLEAMENKRETRAEELVRDFLAGCPVGRELLVSLIERVELTEEKEILLYFRFREPEALSSSSGFTLAQGECIPH